MSLSLKYLPLAALVVLGLILGACAADPTADAPAATVTETPAPEPEPVAETAATSFGFSDASTIGFVGSKVTGSHEGGFKTFGGAMEITEGDLGTLAVRVEIETGSLWADNEKLTGHLKSAEFFGVEEHPTATFESTSITAQEDGSYLVTGNLDLHGVTKSISFPATIEAAAAGTYTVKAEFSIKRFDFDIVYPGKADDLIRDDVLIKLDLLAARANT